MVRTEAGREKRAQKGNDRGLETTVTKPRKCHGKQRKEMGIRMNFPLHMELANTY